MKRVLWIFAAVLFAHAGKLQAQTASFNFSLNPATISGWTNISGDPATGIRTGSSSGITVSSISRTNWASIGGVCAANGGGVTNGTFFTGGVMANYWFQYDNYYAQFNASVPQLLISGLNKDSMYTIKMTGTYGLTGPYELNPIRYTVSGAIIYGNIDVNGDHNTSNGAVFNNIMPDSNGTVKVYVNTYGNSNVASICGLQIIAGHVNAPTPVVAIAHPSNNSILPEDGNITINATASETGGVIRHVEFYLDSTKIGEDSIAPYNLTWAASDPGTYLLKARAIDSFGNASTATVTITVESLNYFWSTTGNIATGGDTSFVGTVDTNRLAFRTNNLERMSISKDGNVTIGVKDTTNHTTMRVYSNGGVLLPRLTSVQRNALASANLQNGLLLYNTDSSLFQYYNGSVWNSVGSGSSGRWLFSTGTSGTVYDSLDNVAIGTNDTKGYKLAVKGTALFTRVQVLSASNWPDYVFKKEYRLRKLEDLASYIDKYHHLPEIVSAAKVGKDGFDLGANQAAILKKVEELTLYLIDENKRLSSQNSQVEGQSKKVAELETKLAGQARQIAEQNALFQQQQRQIDELKALIKKK